jgi:hypothetical protein
MYQYGDRLETQPDPQTVYVVCKDGSVQSVTEPDKPIGWEIGDGWYRPTQTGFGPILCAVSVIGHADVIPDGRGKIGSQVCFMYSREVAFDTESQDAQITHEDDEDDEVTSSISFCV